MKQYGIEIDLERDSMLSEFAYRLISDYYLQDNETSAQQAFARAAVAYSFGDLELAQRIYDYASRGWFMFSSPILSNAPAPGQRSRGLPISCYLNYVPDSLKGLIDHTVETRWLAVNGGGVGGHWSDVRSVSDIAPSPIPFLHTIDADMGAYSQGRTRRGSYAAYLNVDHPDIEEFLVIRTPTGDIQRKAFNLHHGINISDAFMEAVLGDRPWQLIDPHDKTVRKVISARKLWERILETRARTGEPYLNFIDEVNRHLPETLKSKGLVVRGSNLCIEIHLPTNEERTAVCCLSSLNIEKFDEWKDTLIVQDLIRFLDNVLEYFIQTAPPELSKAVYSAQRERSLGLGAMGFHYYLQKHGIPFESALAMSMNRKIFSHIKAEAVKATEELALDWGEYLDGIGSGRRNSHLLAIAPNSNSAVLLNTSPSIEPSRANAYTHRTRAGAALIRNPYLLKLLEAKGKNTDDVWSSIVTNKGSVQHLPFLSDSEKMVFKTAVEIDQRWVVDLAAERQRYICQGQSLNLFFPARSERSYVNAVHLRAWRKKCKSLYYLRTESTSAIENISTPNVIGDSSSDCLACEG